MTPAFNKKAEFTGEQAVITNALKGFIKSLPSSVQDMVLGAALYEFYDRNTVVMMANAEGPMSDVNHQASLSDKLLHTKMDLSKTSLGESLNSGKPVSFVRSKFSANHECMNVILKNDGLFDQSIIQVAFKKHNALKEIVPDSTKSHLLGDAETLIQNAGLVDIAKNFHKKYAGKRWESHFDIGSLKSREGFLAYFDLKNSSKIEKAVGHPATINILKAWVDAGIIINTEHHANLQRASGDDLMVFYPAADMSDAEKALLLNDNIMPAAYNLKSWYEEYKAKYKEPMRDTHFKLALTYGVMTPTWRVNKSYSDEGTTFLKNDYMMESFSSSTKGGFIAVDETVVPLMNEEHMKGFKHKGRSKPYMEESDNNKTFLLEFS